MAVGDRVGIWAPNCAPWTLLQYATAKIGAILVNINPAYRTHELEFVLNQAGVSVLVAASSFKTLGLRGDDRARSAATARACSSVVIIDSDEWTGLFDRVRRTSPACARCRRTLTPDDPINIQYTSGTTGFPKGATLSHHNILNNGFFVGQLMRLLRRRPRLHPGALLPLLRHGHGQPRLHQLRRDDGHPGARVRPDAHARGGRRRSAAPRSTACRRCSSPSWALDDFESYDLTSLRTGIMAGSPCPIEVMKQVVERMGMSEVAISYGMTETSPVSTQTRTDDSLDRRVSTVGRTMPTSSRRSSTRRPAAPCRAASPASCAPAATR